MKKAAELETSKITIKAQSDEPVSKLIGNMKKNDAEEALIFKDKSFKGVFSHFLMLRSRIDSSRSMAEKFTIPAARLAKDTGFFGVINQMLDTSIRALPVMENHDVEKVIDAYSVLDEAKKVEKAKDISVHEIMQEFVSVTEDERLGEILHLMHSKKLKEIPILGSDGKAIGFVASKKILESYHLMHTLERKHGQVPNTPQETTQTQQPNLLSLPAGNFMERDFQVIDADASMSDAAEMMLKKRMLMLVVVQNRNPIGIVSAEDILIKVLELGQPQVRNIFFKGLDELKADDLVIENVQKIAENQAPKLQNYFDNIFDLTIHLKEHQKEGKQHRYEVKSRITYPGSTIAADATDWDIVTAVRMSLDKLEKILESKYKEKPVTGKPQYTYDVAVRKDIEIPNAGNEGNA